MRRDQQKIFKVATAVVAAVTLFATLDVHAVWQDAENPNQAAREPLNNSLL